MKKKKSIERRTMMDFPPRESEKVDFLNLGDPVYSGGVEIGTFVRAEYVTMSKDRGSELFYVIRRSDGQGFDRLYPDEVTIK